MGQCPSGKTYQQGLCYTPCRSGFSGVGPVCYGVCPSGYKNYTFTCGKKPPYKRKTQIPNECGSICPNGGKSVLGTCWPNCPSGTKDFGVGCQKPNPKGRGWGWIHKHSCETKNHDGKKYGCEKCGALYYPKCQPGWEATTCNFCALKCPSGGCFTDGPTSCTKKAYAASCPSGYKNTAGICYEDCKDGYYGVAIDCWEKCAGNTYNAGAFCTKDTYGRGAGTTPNIDWQYYAIIVGVSFIILMLLIMVAYLIYSDILSGQGGVGVFSGGGYGGGIGGGVQPADVFKQVGSYAKEHPQEFRDIAVTGIQQAGTTAQAGIKTLGENPELAAAVLA